MKTALFLFLTVSFNLLIAQPDLEMIKRNYENILKSKTTKEKLDRNCRFQKMLIGIGDMNLDSDTMTRSIDLSEIDGFYDLLDAKQNVRIISNSFELEQSKYQYCMQLVCKKAQIEEGLVLFRLGGTYCQNDLDLDPLPCHLSNKCNPMDWPGAVYYSMNTEVQDSSLYLHMKGMRFENRDTTQVNHTFFVSDKCKITYLESGSKDATR